jgi:hypothetical protein
MSYEFDTVGKFVPDTAEKKRVTKLLEKGVYEVMWRSKDGKKVMDATLDDKYMPGSALIGSYIPVETVHQTQKGAETVRVYSTDRQGWRSFNVNNVISITKLQK